MDAPDRSLAALDPLFREPVPRARLSKAWALTRLRTRIFLSYKTFHIIEFLSLFSMVGAYAFMGLLVRPEDLARAGYGTSYLAFALVGVASSQFLTVSITRIGHIMVHELMGGTFEAVMATPIRLRDYAVGQVSVGFILGSYMMVGTLAVGTLAFGAPLVLNLGTALSALLLVLLMVFAHLGIGILAAGILMVHKKGDPVTFILDTTIQLLGGVLYPLSLLGAIPALAAASAWLPFTWALDALRKVLLGGATLVNPDVAGAALALVAAGAVLLPSGILAFRRGFAVLRRAGATGAY
ncbi:MAG: ABC transporter permease [Halobacteria archaeon]